MPYMLDKDLAQQFIRKAALKTKYEINIMDCQGYIIASSDPSRIGSFHEVAYELVKKKQETAIVEDDSYIGARLGVNTLLTYRGNIEGVIGIHGNPKEVVHFVGILKIAMETMMEYAAFKDETLSYKNQNQQILTLILDTNTSAFQLSNQLESFHYDSQLMRIPCLIENSGKTISDEHLLFQLHYAKIIHAQDIAMVYKNHCILVLKMVDAKERYNYRENICQWYQEIKQSEHAASIKGIVVGFPQQKPSSYKEAILQTSWLFRQSRRKETPQFLCDHIDGYFRQSISFKDLHTVFECYQALTKRRGFDNYAATFEAYLSCFGNINETAKQLGVHRNTVLLHLNKLNQLFHLNVMKNYTDALFFSYFLQYYRLTSKINTPPPEKLNSLP